MRRSTIIGAVLAGGLALAGCTPSEEPSTQPPAPGTPQPATAQAPGGAGESGEGGSEHTGTDQEFAQQLLTHHQQLAEISSLASQNSQKPQVQQLGAEILRTQQSEIGEIETWLASTSGQESGSAPEDAAGSGAEIPGLQPQATVDQLRQAKGPAFDQQWKQAVIALQEGSLQMAQAELDEGSAEQMRTLAEKIVGSRQADIDKLKALG